MGFKKNGYHGYAFSALFCLCLICAVVAAPVAAAATTEVTVTKMSEDGSSVVNETTVSWQWMKDNLAVLGDGQTMYYTQGPVFEGAWEKVHPNETYDPWNPTEDVNLVYKDHGEFMGTDVDDLCGLVGGASDEGMVEIKASDGMYKTWPSEYITDPTSRQGPMGILWYHGTDYGYVNESFTKGMRLYFFGETTNDDGMHVWGNWDMHESWDEKYWHYFNGVYPGASGVSVQNVNSIKIFQPDCYDFAGNNTLESAYSMDTEITGATDLAKIAADDGVSYSTVSTADGEKAAQHFVFDLSEDAANIDKLAFTWDGTSSHDDGSADQGATISVLTSSGYEALTGDLTSDISDYVINGDVTVLVEQNAGQFYDENDEEDKKSRLSTDYVKLVVTHHHSN